MHGRAMLYIGVIALVFLAARIGQYSFYFANISPAVIWPPAGITLALVVLFGYEMALPIMCGFAAAVFTSPGALPPFVAVVSIFAQTLQSLLGAFILEKSGFKTSFESLRDTIVFFVAIIFTAMIAPSFTTLAQIYTHTLSDPLLIVWSRGWAARLVSILVVTPLILSWWAERAPSFDQTKLKEATIAFGVLILSISAFFLIVPADPFTFPILIIALMALFWISLRFDMRAVTLAIFLMTLLSLFGLFQTTSVFGPLRREFFYLELLLILTAPVLLVFAALTKALNRSAENLKQYVAQLEHTMRRLNREDQSKNEFIAILAHELRNPLAPVMSMIEYLDLKPQDPDVTEMIRSAREQTNGMRRLLDDLLDVARVAQKKFRLQIDTVDLKEIVDRSVRNVSALYEKRRHELIVSLPKQSICLQADALRLEQIIVNLLNNAAKYTEPGGTVRLVCTVQKETVEISVSDNGIGVAQKDLSRIFEPFRQVRSNPQFSTGLGIGLSLVKRLAEMHGGSIRAESAGQGKGSKFTVRLPLPDHLSFLTMNQNYDRTQLAAKRSRVLIVDDNEAAARGLSKLLEIKGHTTAMAFDGAGAITEAERFEPEVILLDIGLPDVSGYEVARRLREGKSTALLVALTGYGQEEDKMKARGAGFDHHLTKPVGIADVEALLERNA